MLKDFRLIALTFLLYKCMERIKTYQHTFKGFVDLLQFAYLSNQSSVDASLTIQFFYDRYDHFSTIFLNS